MNAAPALFPTNEDSNEDSESSDAACARGREESGVSLIQRFIQKDASGEDPPHVHAGTTPTGARSKLVTSTAALQQVPQAALDGARDESGSDESVPEAVLEQALSIVDQAVSDAVAQGDALEPREDDKDVALAIDGDRNAFCALYKRYRGIVFRVVCRMGVPQSDLEDTIQEVFVQVHRSLRDFRSQAKFSTWLHRVAVNVVLMQRRALKSRPQYAEEPTVEVAGDHALPDDEAERNERVRAFDRMLNKLAEKKRTVFVLHDLEGMTPQEIADIVDAPVLTVRTRLFYARRELEVMIAGEPALAQVRGTFSKAALEQS